MASFWVDGCGLVVDTHHLYNSGTIDYAKAVDQTFYEENCKTKHIYFMNK